MLVNCKSCQKKFNVPDSAITESGRLLQCGSCGNKWTQYPIKQESIKVVKQKKELSKPILDNIRETPKKNEIKKPFKKKKRKINLYSEEYLQKKHGLTIKSTSGDKKLKRDKKIIGSSSFFNYLIITTIFIISFYGILNLTKDFIITVYPSTEFYINSLYEIIEIIKLTIFSLIN
jgi:predicted Zn finger-like uncharacterized protein